MSLIDNSAEIADPTRARKVDAEHAAAKQESTDQSSRPNRLLTFILAAMGTIALFKSRWDAALHDDTWVLVVETGVYLSISLCLLFGVRKLGRWRPALFAGYLLLPLVTFIAYRGLAIGEAFEFLLLLFCQNISLATVALFRTRGSQQLSVLFSFFLVFFVSAISESASIFIITIPYLMLGVWWLMVNHWSRLEVHLPNKVSSNFKIHSLSFASMMLLVLVFIVVIGWKHEPIMQTINGIMPTSGGKRFTDRYARGGVGDGDFFVAARNQASTVGPVESDLFLESSKPSLFDIMEESYARPLLPIKKKSERAFSPDDVELKHARDKIIQSEQSGRTFRILRGDPDRNQKLTESRSNALFYLVGPTPIRLSWHYFDYFDGLDWSVSQEVKKLPRKKFAGTNFDDQFWIRFQERQRPLSRDKEGSAKPSHPFFQGLENHSVKIMRLATNRVITPSSVTGWHFDKCDDAGYFGYASDGAIVFEDRETIPELAIYHLISKGVNYSKLSQLRDVSLARPQSPYSQLPEFRGRKAIDELAHRITRDAITDWQKVEAIIEHLREEFSLVTGAKEHPGERIEDRGSPVEEFLESKSGPDFMFATVAALMLRSLDMEARLVNGFYVDQTDYDAYSAQSIVHNSNVHFWVEVRVNGSDWITIEPSPGYLPPRSKFTTAQRIGLWFASMVGWCYQNLVAIAGLVILAVLCWVFRLQILSALLLIVWLAEGSGSLQRRVLATLSLMRRRVRLNSAASGASVAELCDYYLQSARSASEEKSRNLKKLVQAIDQLLYRSNPVLESPLELRQACRSIAFSRISAPRG